MRIMRQPQEVASEVLRQFQLTLRVRALGHASAAQFFVVQAHPLEEDLLAVQQNLLALHLNRPKADLIRKGIRTAREPHLVEPRLLRRPEFRLRLDPESGDALCVGLRFRIDVQFRDLHARRHARTRIRQADTSLQYVQSPLRALQDAFGNIGLRQVEERHVPRDAAVIPPVEGHARDALGMPRRVRPHHERMRLVGEQRRHVERERREAALVRSEQLSVQPDVGPVVDRAEPENGAPPRPCGPRELPPQPHRPFVVEERPVDRVPVRRHVHRRRPVEIVLHELHPVLPQVLVELRRTEVLRIEDVAPRTVQRDRIAHKRIQPRAHIHPAAEAAAQPALVADDLRDVRRRRIIRPEQRMDKNQ